MSEQKTTFLGKEKPLLARDEAAKLIIYRNSFMEKMSDEFAVAQVANKVELKESLSSKVLDSLAQFLQSIPVFGSLIGAILDIANKGKDVIYDNAKRKEYQNLLNAIPTHSHNDSERFSKTFSTDLAYEINNQLQSLDKDELKKLGQDHAEKTLKIMCQGKSGKITIDDLDSKEAPLNKETFQDLFEEITKDQTKKAPVIQAKEHKNIGSHTASVIRHEQKLSAESVKTH